ncbi:hypothetical protein ALP12_200237 [Pseudomonas savastanoi pv. phaseolicola]|nr:hypothetical protein ALP12_200237 [Pseudomonas savastanoi pv. phaseolicola]
MVAAHRVKPGLVQPLDHVFALRASVNQIANAEQPINCRVETRSIQSGLQPGEVPVYVAHREIPASRVLGEAFDAHHLHCFEHDYSSPADHRQAL